MGWGGGVGRRAAGGPERGQQILPLDRLEVEGGMGGMGHAWMGPEHLRSGVGWEGAQLSQG